MGHIKEPDGVDFVINSRPLTKEEELAISEYIRTYKMKHSHIARKLRTTLRKKKSKITFNNRRFKEMAGDR